MADRSGRTGDQLRFEFQRAVIDTLASAHTAEGAAEALLPRLATALNSDFAAFWVVSDGTIDCVKAWTGDPAIAPFAAASQACRFSPGEGFPGRVWQQHRSLWLADLERDPQFPRAFAARQVGLCSGFAFPVVAGLEVLGVIECFSRQRQEADDRVLDLAGAVGKQIGQFLRRLEAEARLKENEQRFAAIVNGALDAIIAIDPGGFVTEFNPAAEALFGWTRAEVLGREMADAIIPPEFRDAHRAGLRRQRESGESRILERRLELRARRRDGSEFPVELTITRFAGRSRDGFIGFLRDITDRQRHASERDALLALEQAAAQEASAANRLKDEFLAALSHELRTPLNAILGWVQILEQGQLSGDKAQAAIATIRRNAEAQHRLILDMLDVSAFITGRFRLELVPVNLRTVTERACDSASPAARAKGIRIRLRVPDVDVLGDADRLQQVFWNLLGNAVKFTPAGGSIVVSAAVHADAVRVSVRDTGEGISPDLLPFVFDRFRQGSGRPGGLGLGLAIAKQIVEAHGGSIAASSEGRDAGAEFTVTLRRIA